MRQAALNSIYELAKKDSRVIFIGSDLSAGTLDSFKKELPKQFLMEGVSEQNIIGISAGLAMEGKIPYVNTIATFITRRCYEQVVLDLCLHNLNVRLLGNGGGVVYAPLGPTHEAIEDIAIMRAIPNMTVICPADPEEMKKLVELTLDHQGPIYMRIAKGKEPIVVPAAEKLAIGKGVLLRKGKDALLISTGVTLKMCLDSADVLQKEGIDVSVLHLHTVKPIDKDFILRLLADIDMVFTIEEHSIIGGLGSAVAEIIATSRFKNPKLLKIIGMPDEFQEKYGTQTSLMKSCGISCEDLVECIKKVSKSRL